MTSAEALAHLGIFTGKWLTTGRQHASPAGPDAPVTAVETYEWLQGDTFLIHRFDGKVGDDSAACIEIIGRDSSNEDYSVQTFYNNGVTNRWRLHERDRAWLLTGKWRLVGNESDVRCTTVFSDDGAARASKWEHYDGSSWHTFWDVEAIKQI